MYAQYTILAVVFSGQQHISLEVFQFIRKLIEACNNIFSLILILKFFCYIYKLGEFVCLGGESFIQAKLVLKRFLLLEYLLRILLVVPEALLQTLVLELFYPFPKTLRVKDSLPLPLSAL